MSELSEQLELATFGSGCFWCSEAVFEMVYGVTRVIPGYAGGQAMNPSYEDVCTGETGHAEVVQITFNPDIISYQELLKIFWRTHDPTTLNRQGNDTGTQYRSIIFYHNENQKQIAEKYKIELDNSGAWDNPVVTEIVSLNNFFEAEDYHHNYFKNNPEQAYCSFVIAPKIEKFEKAFKEMLK